MNIGDYVKFKQSGNIYRVKREDVGVRPFIGQRHAALLDEEEYELTDEPPHVIVYEVAGKLFVNKDDALQYGEPIERKVYG